MLKQVFCLLLLFVFPVLLYAQQLDSPIVKKDSLIKKDSLRKKDKTIKNGASLVKQSDSLLLQKDTLIQASVIRALSYSDEIKKMLYANRFLNWKGESVAMVTQIRKVNAQDNFFYLLAIIAALMGFFRFFYTRYFNNLFRVFFNASLRQSQLTDQLLQAKLPSLFFNILFVFSGGVFVYFLLRHYNKVAEGHFWQILFYCTIGLGIIYFIKFCSLKFIGWLTGYKEITNTYVFIIFLINKILGILLIPFTVIIAFSTPTLVTVAVIISLLLIGLLLLLRFFRSYGLLQHQLKISGFHFFMYIAAIEVVPVLLIYKGLILLLSKNL